MQKLSTFFLATAFSAALAGATTPVTLGYSRHFSLGIGNGLDQARGCAVDKLGNTYYHGATQAQDYYVETIMKYDPNGIPLWQISIPIRGYGKFIRVAPTGNIYLVGQATRPDFNLDTLVMKLDSKGTIKWTRTYDGGGSSDDAPLDLVEMGDGSARLLARISQPASRVLGILTYKSDGYDAAAPHFDTSFDPNEGFFTADGHCIAAGTSGNKAVFRAYEPNYMPGIGETAANAGTVSYTYTVGLDPLGNYYVGKETFDISLPSPRSYTLRIFTASGTYLGGAIDATEGLGGFVATDPDHVYAISPFSAGSVSLTRYTKNGKAWSASLSSVFNLAADGTKGVVVVRTTSIPFSTYIDHFSEMGALDWTANATRNYVMNSFQISPPVVANGIVRYFTWISEATGRYLFIDQFVGGTALNSVSFPSATIASGMGILGAANLNQADASTHLLKLTSSNPLALSLPTSALVPANLNKVGFQATAGIVDVDTKVTIVAAGGGVNRATTVTVLAAPLEDVMLAGTTVQSGVNVGGQVHLAGVTGNQGRLVKLSSSNPTVASVPTAVAIAPGASSANFTVKTFSGKTGTATITATALGVAKSFTLTVN